MHQTEVHRIMRMLSDNGVSGEPLLQKFRSAARGDIKLACALLGCFTEAQDAYLPYIRSRIRPAVTELVLAGMVTELEKLDALVPLTRTLTEEALETAITAQVPDSTIWLLKLKADRFGFTGGEAGLPDA